MRQQPEDKLQDLIDSAINKLIEYAALAPRASVDEGNAMKADMQERQNIIREAKAGQRGDNKTITENQEKDSKELNQGIGFLQLNNTNQLLDWARKQQKARNKHSASDDEAEPDDARYESAESEFSADGEDVSDDSDKEEGSELDENDEADAQAADQLEVDSQSPGFFSKVAQGAGIVAGGAKDLLIGALSNTVGRLFTSSNKVLTPQTFAAIQNELLQLQPPYKIVPPAFDKKVDKYEVKDNINQPVFTMAKAAGGTKFSSSGTLDDNKIKAMAVALSKLGNDCTHKINGPKDKVETLYAELYRANPNVKIETNVLNANELQAIKDRVKSESASQTPPTRSGPTNS